MDRMLFALKTFIALALASAILTACWDKTELNELALVSMVGVDSDPESGRKTVYYQIINPLSGTSARGTPGGEQAPVYTYEFSAQSFGEIKSNAYKVLPRKLFIAHYKTLIVSQRAAREGLRDIVNFIEIQPAGRSSIPMLVAEGSLSKIMNTFTPLERVPSDTVISRLKFLARDSWMVGKHINVNDVIEHMEKSDMIVLPMIREKTPDQSQNSGQTASRMAANHSNFIIGGGAVFQDYRMAGRLSDGELIWYRLLDGDRGRQAKQFQLNGKKVTVEMKPVHLDRSVQWRSSKPRVTIRLELEASTIYSIEYVPQSTEEIKRLENSLSQAIADELYALYKKTKANGWELPQIKESLKRSNDAEEADVVFKVHTKLLQIGSLSKPY